MTSDVPMAVFIRRPAKSVMAGTMPMPLPTPSSRGDAAKHSNAEQEEDFQDPSQPGAGCAGRS